MVQDVIPLWLVFVGIILCVAVSLEGGYRLGRIAHRLAEDEKEPPVSVISGSVLGLGAFMLAFTFSIVSSRFDARKELVRDEANAIRIAWLRSEFLPERERAEAKDLIRQYLDTRIAFAQSSDMPVGGVESFVTGVERIQARLWEVAVANARNDMDSDVAALYIEALNDVAAIHALRMAIGLQLRIPMGIWCLLIVLTCLGMVGIGYHTGIVCSRRSLAQPILAISFAMVIAFIADLDRTRGGFIRVSQQPMLDLQSWMDLNAEHSARQKGTEVSSLGGLTPHRPGRLAHDGPSISVSRRGNDPV